MKELNLVYKGGKFNLEYLNFNTFFFIIFSNLILGALYLWPTILLYFYNLKFTLPLRAGATCLYLTLSAAVCCIGSRLQPASKQASWLSIVNKASTVTAYYLHFHPFSVHTRFLLYVLFLHLYIKYARVNGKEIVKEQ